ncbi:MULTISPECIES: DNA/RNA non-specific endonuclease [unclassified Acinetobacter]|uniref:DNA/RNA non-specific endonuclease n=1 Tax=unclassified Acinetobacter TaxID=196816 RepID=UPI0029348A21|nr:MULTISPECIES: DNA/RNA non-specific endonuclease [unclassified Acinetobacter]WOE31023.1 DNA/RNA non-specific endonuclease [Acinetobacter sp. SAAs470]WOE39219.1 DNA/RNA non-specific endonuclease [Acinetobacter sp. SAAs474]
MVKKKRSSKNFFSPLWSQNGLKIILGLIASCSFAIAFGQEKISQWVQSTSLSTNTACLNQFYRDTPPYLVKDSLKKDSYPLCFNGFNVMYSGRSKTPLWSAEALTPQRLSQKIPREDSFHEETRVPSAYRAVLADYKGSGFDRGHMAPNADMPNKEAQSDSFSLANMVPQAPKNNQKIWREIEEATRAIVTKQKQDVYVVTGPVFLGQKLKTIGNGVIVPTAVFKALYIPKTGAIGAYYAPNDNSLKMNVVSVCYLEEKLGINLFPQLTSEQKRNTYKLPHTANAVKANQPLEYSHWDAESQCAEDVTAEQLQQLQQSFKSSSPNSNTATSTIPDTNNVESWITKLLAILQYILQLLK